MRHLNTLFDLSPTELIQILDLSAEIKSETRNGQRTPRLAGRQLTLLFEKPSLRTRLSFEAAMTQLGGSASFFTTRDAGLDGRESMPDVARVLTSFSDAVAMRTFSQQLIEDFAVYASCPIINGLSDDRHPCQALTDLLTIREAFSKTAGIRLAYIGDGNNVCSSLAIGCAMTDIELLVAAPEGFQLPDDFLEELSDRYPTAKLAQFTDPYEAVQDADVVYTDVWASMGQEEEQVERQRTFAPFQVNEALMEAAPKGSRFMHDLPAKRGLEVTDDVMDGETSLVFQQAENRMHLAKGLLVWLIEGA